MTGLEFFDTHKDNDDKCKLLQKMDELALAEWELETVSEHSPGPIASEEMLYQQILDPTQIAPGGEGLKSMAFDVCSSHGLSTNRLEQSSLDELVQKGADRANAWNQKFPAKPPRSLWGFVPFKVRDVRNILCQESGTRGLFVYDTADADDQSHAEICQGGVNSSARIQARNVRTSLYLLAKRQLISLADLQQDGS
jgi:hypothetical protein